MQSTVSLNTVPVPGKKENLCDTGTVIVKPENSSIRNIATGNLIYFCAKSFACKITVVMIKKKDA